MKSFRLSVVTPDRLVFEGAAVYLAVPGSAGHMGVLADHEPLIATLDPGPVEIRAEGKPEPLVLSLRFPALMEITPAGVSLLLDAGDPA